MTSVTAEHIETTARTPRGFTMLLRLLAANWTSLVTFQKGLIWTWIGNSAFYCVAALCITLIISIPAGYAMAHTEFPGRKALLAGNDSMALGAVSAVRAAGKKDQVQVVGYDNINAIKPMLKDGRVLATADQFAAKQAVFGIETALKILKGEKVDSGVNGVIQHSAPTDRMQHLRHRRLHAGAQVGAVRLGLMLLAPGQDGGMLGGGDREDLRVGGGVALSARASGPQAPMPVNGP